MALVQTVALATPAAVMADRAIPVLVILEVVAVAVVVVDAEAVAAISGIIPRRGKPLLRCGHLDQSQKHRNNWHDIGDANRARHYFCRQR